MSDMKSDQEMKVKEIISYSKEERELERIAF